MAKKYGPLIALLIILYLAVPVRFMLNARSDALDAAAKAREETKIVDAKLTRAKNINPAEMLERYRGVAEQLPRDPAYPGLLDELVAATGNAGVTWSDGSATAAGNTQAAPPAAPTADPTVDTNTGTPVTLDAGGVLAAPVQEIPLNLSLNVSADTTDKFGPLLKNLSATPRIMVIDKAIITFTSTRIDGTAGIDDTAGFDPAVTGPAAASGAWTGSLSGKVYTWPGLPDAERIFSSDDISGPAEGRQG
jgi:hypothetical protein